MTNEERARKLVEDRFEYDCDSQGLADQTYLITQALDQAERRGIERAAKIAARGDDPRTAIEIRALLPEGGG
jgi:hypothetical protein